MSQLEIPFACQSIEDCGKAEAPKTSSAKATYRYYLAVGIPASVSGPQVHPPQAAALPKAAPCCSLQNAEKLCAKKAPEPLGHSVWAGYHHTEELCAEKERLCAEITQCGRATTTPPW